MKLIDQIESKIINRNEIDKIKSTLLNKKIIFTNGCFDILHPGHITYLSMARDLGDVLWIGLNSDDSVKRLKGNNRPINQVDDRALLLAAMMFVDFVTVFSEDTPVELIKVIKPDIHTKGGDYKKEDLPEFRTISQYGGKVEIIPFLKGKSTSALIQKIQTSAL